MAQVYVTHNILSDLSKSLELPFDINSMRFGFHARIIDLLIYIGSGILKAICYRFWQLTNDVFMQMAEKFVISFG